MATTKKATKTTVRKKKLVIVESPSKARTIGRFLGSGYKVIASVGHVRDLPKSKLGIDIKDDFEPQYIAIRGKGDIIKELKKEAAKASGIYLATDPDREGEAISWHLANILGIDPSSPCRIEFNEITRNTIKEAIKHPRAIDQNLVDAQQARRVLDRLVGYQISPLLWQKIKRGLSAGRVQSAALKLICDREKEINAFVPKEYWTITAEFAKDGGFAARLAEKNGRKHTVRTEAEKNKVLSEIDGKPFTVESISRNERKVKSFAPYTTSSLQQDASIRLNFNTKKTMKVAQELYEGIDITGHGHTGLITYLRTDSVRISQEAKAAAKEYIISTFGDKYYGNNYFSNKKKDIQDAHEAIRPSHIDLLPDQIKKDLTSDQYKLYKLIWQRFMASQMAAAVYDSMQVTMVTEGYGFRASGSRILFDGYRKVYKTKTEEDDEKMLPEMTEGVKMDAESVTDEQNFTQPPPRFTEASLVKELESQNIGRPSTYAPIVSTLTERKYVKRDKKSLVPTDLGTIVDELMETYFENIVDAGFTAKMEDKLDDVEIKGEPWKKVIREFYVPFKKELDAADAAIERVKVEDRPAGEICEICGRPMVIKASKYGDFIACSGYPECKNTKSIVKTTGVKCPKCGKDIVEKTSRRGKVFYGCSGYPKCTESYWYKPVNKTCPRCGSLLVEKSTKHGKLSCSNKDCGYAE